MLTSMQLLRCQGAKGMILVIFCSSWISICLPHQHGSRMLGTFSNPKFLKFSDMSTKKYKSCFPKVCPFIKHRRFNQVNMLLSSVAKSSDEDDQRGMKDAFDALETLFPGDLLIDSRCSETTGSAGLEEAKPQLKYSRTDDTPLSSLGKSSVDEAKYYLEMQNELEGSSMSANTESVGAIEVETGNYIDSEEPFLFCPSDDQSWTSINPILRLRGAVAIGYGRGGKKLGVPTANLPASLFQHALEAIDAGVYFGWAVIEQKPGKSKKPRDVPIKAVVNIGYSPTFEGTENKEKIVEAHLITRTSPMINFVPNEDTVGNNSLNKTEEIEIEGEFYGETMRLQLIGFLRPEQKFDSFSELVAQIQRDIGSADWALSSFPYNLSKEDEFISTLQTESFHRKIWIGSGGGDEFASWEYEAWL